ncbi:putative TEL2-interacting protein 1 [Amylocarpus encephaloides]|uniref:TEL2-interacting protein 1 n=1 Tax=Amylocarpus encephaloides TaxID=45428 RepID=A0A9P8C0C4_9HELO|nr:putative TEL2-interacting protein 1 [Amylocarpus encephaloides]
MDTAARSARNELFQILKPPCVELTQLALRDDGSASSTKSLIKSTAQLLLLLEKHCRTEDGAFDEKLAEYVFFPLSQILKKKKKYTDHLAELVMRCIGIILEYGWARTIPLELGKQLLILLAFVAGGSPDQEQTIPEEVITEAYGALAALFRDLGLTPGGAAALVDTSTVPALGHCMTVMLEGITVGASAQVQLQALKALDAAWRSIKDIEALATFLPGTISALTKTLMPGTANRRSRKTLVNALSVLEHVLATILSDVRTRSIRKEDQSSTTLSAKSSDQIVFTKSWLKATTGQIKLALSNVLRLRKSDAPDVRKALHKFCLTILDECHDTLSDSGPLLVETSLMLGGSDEDEDFLHRKASLADLSVIHPDIGELVKITAYNWVASLPRVMQANDETAKYGALDQLQKASNLLKKMNFESSVLEGALGASLRDSISLTLSSSVSTIGLQETEFDLNSQSALTLASNNSLSTEFRPLILAEESQKRTRDSLMDLVGRLGTREAQITVAREMLEYVRGASGPSLVAAYWLSFQTLRAAADGNQDMDDFFDSALTLSGDQEDMNEELMAYSQSVLVDSDDGQYDWRMKAIALEVVADRAAHLKEQFRPELIDTLYPIAQLLGSPNDKLREHAITCLHAVSTSCGYTNASELVIDNVDYMVNAISLRLNTFDISPQTPQVLVMMLRLTGPSLLLYLDDVVGSIFAALDNFHGYQRLVDILFSVLDEIVKVGSKSDQLQISDVSTVESRGNQHTPLTVTEIIDLLQKNTQTSERPEPHEPFPRKPWKSAATLLDEAEARTEPPPSTTLPDEDGKEEEPPPPQELAPPPPTKTYQLLTSITSLSQHYLTSPSAHLRTKLLSLIATASPGLAGNQEKFLPLVNDIWPVVIPLIHDPSSYVCITALSTITTLAQICGDFLRTRITTEWKSIVILARAFKSQAKKEQGSNRGVYSEGSKKWEGMVALLCSCVRDVRVEDGMFDDVVEVLGDLLWERERVREALSGPNGNADAVWLACLGRGGGVEQVFNVPDMEGNNFVGVMA